MSLPDLTVFGWLEPEESVQQTLISNTSIVNEGGNVTIEGDTINIANENTTEVTIGGTEIFISNEHTEHVHIGGPVTNTIVIGDKDAGENQTLVVNTKDFSVGRYIYMNKNNEDDDSDGGLVINVSVVSTYEFEEGQSFGSNSVMLKDTIGILPGEYLGVRGTEKNDGVYEALLHVDGQLTINPSPIQPWSKSEFVEEEIPENARISVIRITVIRGTNDGDGRVELYQARNTITGNFHNMSYDTCSPVYEKVEITASSDQLQLGEVTISAADSTSKTHTIPSTDAGDEFVLAEAEQELENKVLTDDSNTVYAKALFVQDGANYVSVDQSAAPEEGHVLKATSTGEASWQSIIEKISVEGKLKLNGQENAQATAGEIVLRYDPDEEEEEQKDQEDVDEKFDDPMPDGDIPGAQPTTNGGDSFDIPEIPGVPLSDILTSLLTSAITSAVISAGSAIYTSKIGAVTAAAGGAAGSILSAAPGAGGAAMPTPKPPGSMLDIAHETVKMNSGALDTIKPFDPEAPGSELDIGHEKVNMNDLGVDSLDEKTPGEGIKLKGDLIPDPDNPGSIGTEDAPFSEIHVQTINVSETTEFNNVVINGTFTAPEPSPPTFKLIFRLTHYVGDVPETGGEHPDPIELEFRVRTTNNFTTLEIMEFNPYDIIVPIYEPNFGPFESNRSYFFRCDFSGEGEDEYKKYFRLEDKLTADIKVTDQVLLKTTNITGDTYFRELPVPNGLYANEIYFHFLGSQLSSTSLVDNQIIDLGTSNTKIESLVSNEIQVHELITDELISNPDEGFRQVRVTGALNPSEANTFALGGEFRRWSSLHVNEIGTNSTRVTDGYFTNLHATNVGTSGSPVSNIYASDQAVNNLTINTSLAGSVGSKVVLTDAEQTLTNKTITGGSFAPTSLTLGGKTFSYASTDWANIQFYRATSSGSVTHDVPCRFEVVGGICHFMSQASILMGNLDIEGYTGADGGATTGIPAAFRPLTQQYNMVILDTGNPAFTGGYSIMTCASNGNIRFHYTNYQTQLPPTDGANIQTIRPFHVTWALV